ncbi:MAG: hypothetical protein MUD08_14835 [Cytophagales bacterium]|nr:hypothetical protein [Cytophagales bacterium]
MHRQKVTLAAKLTPGKQLGKQLALPPADGLAKVFLRAAVEKVVVFSASAESFAATLPFAIFIVKTPFLKLILTAFLHFFVTRNINRRLTENEFSETFFRFAALLFLRGAPRPSFA